MRGEEIEVEVNSLAAGGDAVGRQVGGEAAGRAIFVPLAAPEERVRARIVRDKARVAWAELVAVTRPSPVRVAPLCPLFGRCGGCQWQHVEEHAQRRAKAAIVARALRIAAGAPGTDDPSRAAGPPRGLPASQPPSAPTTLAGVSTDSEAGAHASAATDAGAAVSVSEAQEVGPAYGYRERARLTVGLDESGRRAIGFRARRSHHVVDVPACPLLAPALAEALPVVRTLMAHSPAGTEIHLQGGRGASRDEVVMVEAGGRGFRIRGRDVVDVPPADEASWPDVAEPGGRPLPIPAGAFAQVSRLANAALIQAVAERLGARPGRVLELYAGSGTFTRLLVTRAVSVVACDGDRAAVARGARAVPEARWRLQGDLWGAPHDVETVLCDPPREGLDARALELAASASQQLIYVSCDVQTLARDATRLAAQGLRLANANAYDLMPQTHHVEVVALFVR